MVTANIVVPETGASGCHRHQGGSVGGWSLYAHEGKLKYCFNFFGYRSNIINRDETRSPGQEPGADGVQV